MKLIEVLFYSGVEVPKLAKVADCSFRIAYSLVGFFWPFFFFFFFLPLFVKDPLSDPVNDMSALL